jgi:hypothetical protein
MQRAQLKSGWTGLPEGKSAWPHTGQNRAVGVGGGMTSGVSLRRSSAMSESAWAMSSTERLIVEVPQAIESRLKSNRS